MPANQTTAPAATKMMINSHSGSEDTSPLPSVIERDRWKTQVTLSPAPNGATRCGHAGLELDQGQTAKRALSAESVIDPSLQRTIASRLGTAGGYPAVPNRLAIVGWIEGSITDSADNARLAV